MKIFNRLLMEDDGQTLVEYSLIIFLIAIVALGGVMLLSTGVDELWNFNVQEIQQAIQNIFPE